MLSDRDSTAELAPIPSLLLTGAVHHHLVREKTRTQVGLVVEAGDVREVHHVALLIGYGAAAVNPYLAMETVEDLARDGYYVDVEPEQAVRNLVKALGKGVLKVMSKMGVSTVASYTGAQIFEAVGLAQDARRPLLHRHHLQARRRRARRRSPRRSPAGTRTAYPRDGIPPAHRALEVGGEYQWRREGEPHLFDPETVFRLQHATRDRPLRHLQAVHRAGRRAVRAADDAARAVHASSDGERAPIPIDEVEPVSAIVKRFSTGAMSYGSISQEAHETLAIAMNRLGGKSNTGEGGEDADRLLRPRAAQRDQAGRVRPLRRDQRVPHQRRRHPDQDGAGRQARRGRPAARPQGLPVDREDPALHAGRRPDLAAAAPRHLLDRGPRPADPRPEERQPVGAGAREAGRRGRRRHGRRRRLQGARRRRADLRPRRRHRRRAADLAQARRRSVGARPGRDPADAAAQRAARPDRRAGRRPAEDRPRRGHRRAARRRGVRLRHRAAGGRPAAS